MRAYPCWRPREGAVSPSGARQGLIAIQGRRSTFGVPVERTVMRPGNVGLRSPLPRTALRATGVRGVSGRQRPNRIRGAGAAFVRLAKAGRMGRSPWGFSLQAAATSFRIASRMDRPPARPCSPTRCGSAARWCGCTPSRSGSPRRAKAGPRHRPACPRAPAPGYRRGARLLHPRMRCRRRSSTTLRPVGSTSAPSTWTASDRRYGRTRSS